MREAKWLLKDILGLIMQVQTSLYLLNEYILWISNAIELMGLCHCNFD